MSYTPNAARAYAKLFNLKAGQNQMLLSLADQIDTLTKERKTLKDELDTFSLWVLRAGNILGDQACERCNPASDLIDKTFTCAYHKAEDIMKG